MINIKKIERYFLIFFLSLIAIFNHIFVEPKIATSIGYGVIGILFFFETKHKSFFKFLLPLFFAFLAGLVFAKGHETRDIIRDIFYFLNPVFFMILGAFYAKNFNFHQLIKLIIFIGTLLSTVYVIKALFYFGFDVFNNQISVRSALGVGNSLTVLSLVILLFLNKYEISGQIIKVRFRSVFIIINFLALLFFGSRTYFVVFFICLICFSYPFIKKNIFKYSIISLFLIFLSSLLLNSMKDNFVVDKIFNSLTEIKVSEDIDDEDIYKNYRGYETLCAIDTYLQGNTQNLILGRGLGQLIDLKMDIELAGQDWRYIPVLHNGYAYILVKTGLIGICFFFIFLIKIFKLSIHIYHESNLLAIFLSSSVLSIYFVTYVVSGIFNMEFILLLIVIGALIQYSVFTINNVSD